VIERLSAPLPEPASYWSGPAVPPPLLPRNVLAFRRRDAELRGGRGAHSQHHRFVFVAALRGAGRVGLDAALSVLEEGSALLIQPFQSHYYLDTAPRLHWLFVTFDHPPDPRLERARGRRRPLDAEALRLLARFLRAWRYRRAEMALELGRLLPGFCAPAPGRLRGRRPAGGDDLLLQRLQRHAYENRDRFVSLEQTAAALGVSASSLRHRFRLATGRSLGRHLRGIRLEHACRLLASTDRRVGEIAERCGYDTVFAFSRAFAHAYGVSPRAYRDRLNEEAGEK